MAPALTKFLKDGHGIHLSSPPDSSEQSVMGVMDVDFQLKTSDDLQKMLLFVLPTFDSYLQANPLNLPSSTCQSGSLTLPSMGDSAKSYNKTLKEPHLTPSIPPGALDMHSLPEHNGHHRYKCTCHCRPGVRDMHLLFRRPNVSSRFGNDNYNSVLETATLSNQENCNFDQLVPNVELQNYIKNKVLRQTGLKIRAHKLQRRLEVVLGQHALLHCEQQLEGLRTQGGFSADSGLSQGDSGQHFPWPQAHFTEIKEFSQSSRAVLCGLQETLDSEATASSSSDDEPLETEAPSEYRAPCVASPCLEERWLEERAELGSRWNWLQLRVTELEGRIQQLIKLHKNIRGNKGCVVLADPQPVAAQQMKNALWKEVTGLSCSALDADNEPCSPTRLLHNIERQSAQLSQIVNSLLPPLNTSPHSKPPLLRNDWRAFNSDGFVSGNSKGKKFGAGRRKLFKEDLSCVCARTRPLVTYHKPRLFRPNAACRNNCSKCSSILSGFCSCCSSASEQSSCSSGTLSSRTYHSNSRESSFFSHPTKSSMNEEWAQMPLVINTLALSPVNYRRRSSTPLFRHKYKQYTHQHKVLELSPIRHQCCLQREDRIHQRKRKRRRRNNFTEDEEDALSYENNSDDMFEDNFVYITSKQKGKARRRHGESLFDIDNIVIPPSLAKVEKLQYKDILTPSWKVCDLQHIFKDKVDSKDDDNEVEILTDEIFAQRHLPFEQKERKRWSFWGKRHCRRSLRSGSQLSSGVGELCTSGVYNSEEWSFTQLDTGEQQLSSEECLPQAPWERRVFPLNNDEEMALSSEVLQWCLDSTCTLSSSTSLSGLITIQPKQTTLPSGGHYMGCTISDT